MVNPRSGDVEVDQPALVLQVDDGNDGSKGKVRYAWQAADTDTPGTFWGEFEVTFPAAGGIQTFPNDRNLRIQVTPALVD